MKRKQVAAILLSLSMAFVSIMSPYSVSAFAAENAGTDMTEVIEVSDEMNEAAEPFEVEEENPVSTADEQTPDDAEETQGVESLEEVYAGETADESATEEAAEKEPDGEITEEDQIEETAEDASTAEVSEETQETIDEQEEADDVLGEEAVPDTTEEPVTIIEEAVPEEEVQNDAMEYGSDDYPYKNSSTYPSNAADPWGYYYRQCTSFCAFRLNKTNGFPLKNWYQGVNFGNAGTWINAAKSVGITVNKTPAVGAVACWAASSAYPVGHVAWVCGVSGSNVTIEEYNYNNSLAYKKRTIAASNPTNYIHFKDIAVCEHNWVIQKVQTAPTATAKGKWLFKCSKCGSTKTIDIPALGSTNIANGRYMLLSKLGSEKYVSVAPNQAYAGGNIALYSKGASYQTFSVTKKSNGAYLIKYGDYALDVKNQQFHTTVQLNTVNGSAGQDWYIESAGNGWYRLASRCTYYNMDVAGARTNDGTDIQMHWNNGNDAQLFKLVYVGAPCTHNWVIKKVQKAPTATTNGSWLFQCSICSETKTTDIRAYGTVNIANGKYMILSKLGSEKYVSVTPNQAYTGGNIALYSKGAASQTFEIKKNSNGSYLIKYGNYVLDVQNQAFGGNIRLYSANGSAGQDWYIESAGNGWYRLTTRCTYWDMDVANSNTANGTNIQTHYSSGDSQLFKLIKISDEQPLPASTKVTPKNLAGGIKLSWEPVSGAAEYVVYREGQQIKRTNNTVILDGEVKYENGKKFTYKVAAVSKSGKISTNTRSATYYRILPVGITSVKNTGAGKMKVTYGKNEMGSGYVVRYGLNSDMSDAKVIAVKDPNTTSKTFSGLTKGKTYYVQVRSYIIENGIRYYSGYCTTKTVKITK